ncbi:hypothetical protein CYMTET_41369 [Cymbomonas tetramitiformis]|uniref:Uncharacterized protein n=1 Tax=Cymbomonas tetramitiformis TaxID=36881 RepID=A0AAE0C696_9CHLO|nr:hypothetical protein CYMTET_41369 [Cymbomonas tetramitiformis]
MPADRISLASGLRAARLHGGTSPGSPASSPSENASSDPVVPMATLLARPTPFSRSPTSIEFHNDATAWMSTPANVGLSLDGHGAEADCAVHLANMSHVLGPVSRDEVYKLLDLNFEYDAYHYVMNDPIHAMLPTVLRGMTLSLYDESTRVHPHDGRCTRQRLRFHVEGIGDPDTHRFWVILKYPLSDIRKLVLGLSTFICQLHSTHTEAKMAYE